MEIKVLIDLSALIDTGSNLFEIVPMCSFRDNFSCLFSPRADYIKQHVKILNPVNQAP